MSTTSLPSTIRGDGDEEKHRPDKEIEGGKLGAEQSPSSSDSTDDDESQMHAAGASQQSQSQKQPPPENVLSRIKSTRSIRSSRPLDPEKRDPAFEVKWEENDPQNPQNWSTQYRSWITFQLSMIAMACSTASSVVSPAEDEIAALFHTSTEVMVLTVSLYVLGFAIGPIFWAPISEIWGRRYSLIPPLYGLALFSIGVGLAQNTQTILVCRLFSGIMGSGPVANVSAALGDYWSPAARGIAIALYAVGVIGGPALGPVIGAALTNNPHLTWRWTGYLMAIWVGLAALMLTLFFPEVYQPYLLKKRAIKLRRETGDPRWYHPHEDVKVDIKSILTKHLTRPLRMLVTEPMVTCIAFYASFVYGLLYMTLEVFPIVYQQNRHWGLVVSTLPFIALFVGVLFALGVNLANQPRYKRIVAQHGGKAVPEARLAPMIVGGLLFAIGLFWFGWTADPSIFWLSSVIAAGFIGAGFNIIFQQCINFLVDTYSVYAASAVSANTILRSIFAAGLPLAAKPMFYALGVGPAMSLLGGVAVLALPVPFIFMKYGKSLRRMSKFAPFNED